MITPEEYENIKSEVETVGWYKVFSSYLRKDCVLVLAAMLVMDDLYAKEFGVDLLSCNYTSAGSVISSHLDAKINESGCVGFSQIRNSHVAKILLPLRSGGIVEGRIEKSGVLWESEDKAQADHIIGLDLNQVKLSNKVIKNTC